MEIPRSIKILKPKKSYFKHLWKVVIVVCGLAFIIGQFALYLFYAQ